MGSPPKENVKSGFPPSTEKIWPIMGDILETVQDRMQVTIIHW